MTSRAVAVVPVHNGAALLGRCLDALVGADGDVSVVVVDDGSTDDSLRVAESRAGASPGRVSVVSLERNHGFAGAVNRGVAHALARQAPATIVFVNQDCIVSRGFLAPMLAMLGETGVAVTGARLLETDGRTLQHAGARIEPNGLTTHLGRGSVDDSAWREPADVDYVCGALLATTPATWRRFGPLDEGYTPAYFEEVDLCARVRRAGLRVRYVPASEAVHAEASCSGAGSRTFYRRYHRNRLRFVVRELAPQRGTLAWIRSEVSWLASLARSGWREQFVPLAEAYALVPYFIGERLLEHRASARRGAA